MGRRSSRSYESESPERRRSTHHSRQEVRSSGYSQRSRKRPVQERDYEDQHDGRDSFGSSKSPYQHDSTPFVPRQDNCYKPSPQYQDTQNYHNPNQPPRQLVSPPSSPTPSPPQPQPSHTQKFLTHVSDFDKAITPIHAIANKAFDVNKGLLGVLAAVSACSLAVHQSDKMAGEVKEKRLDAEKKGLENERLRYQMRKDGVCRRQRGNRRRAEERGGLGNERKEKILGIAAVGAVLLGVDLYERHTRD